MMDDNLLRSSVVHRRSTRGIRPEATAGIEPADKGFADPGLTTWRRRHTLAFGGWPRMTGVRAWAVPKEGQERKERKRKRQDNDQAPQPYRCPPQGRIDDDPALKGSNCIELHELLECFLREIRVIRCNGLLYCSINHPQLYVGAADHQYPGDDLSDKSFFRYWNPNTHPESVGYGATPAPAQRAQSAHFARHSPGGQSAGPG